MPERLEEVRQPDRTIAREITQVISPYLVDLASVDPKSVEEPLRPISSQSVKGKISGWKPAPW